MKRARRLPLHLQRELKAVESLPEQQIDTSEMPELTDADWERRVEAYYRPLKSSVTMRLDADVLAWFKRQGRGYQTRINQILRQYFDRHR
jgi:uncharacterized protein (DUF4415 family)